MFDILAVTMPGFGTTDRTYNNAVEMIKFLGAEFQEINIIDGYLGATASNYATSSAIISLNMKKNYDIIHNLALRS